MINSNTVAGRWQLPTTPVAERDLQGLRALREEGLLKHHVMVCLETRPRRVDGIEILPWNEFLDRMWEGAFAS